VTRLKRRIADVESVPDRANAGYHPAGTAATPMEAPGAQVTYHPAAAYPWGSVTYEDITPMWAPDGAMIQGTAPGSWGHLRAAGRP
jgi:hypothetical protein